MEVLDQTGDVAGRELHRLITLYPPPDFVKSASSEQLLGDPATLLPHVYGDPRRRQFPAHTPAATWLSMAFLLDKQASLEPQEFQAILERLDKVAAFHGISATCTELREKVAADSRGDEAGLPDDMFAFVYETVAGKERHMPLRNGKEVQAAARYLQKYRDEFTLADRQVIADKVLTKAAQYGADIRSESEFLEKQAGRGVCAAKTVVEAFRQRARLAKNTDFAEQIEKVAQSVAADPTEMRQPHRLQKLATLLDEVDRTLHIEYGEEIQRPEDLLFAVTEKTASTFRDEHVNLLTGNIYKVADLARLSISGIRDWMGDDFVDGVTTGGVLLDQEKLAEVLPTLPKGDAETFDRFLATVGVAPLYKEAAAGSPRLTKVQLLDLAAMST